MIGNHIGDPIIIVFPGSAAEEAVIAIVVESKSRAFDGIPVIDRPIHGALSFEKLPVGMRSYHNARFTRKRDHVQQAVDDDPGPHTIRIVYGEKVLRIEQIPLSIPVLKGMSIDREGLVRDQ